MPKAKAQADNPPEIQPEGAGKLKRDLNCAFLPHGETACGKCYTPVEWEAFATNPRFTLERSGDTARIVQTSTGKPVSKPMDFSEAVRKFDRFGK